jgi:hypothetical protein
MPQQIQLRRGTASQWTTANPTLAEGEMGVETDTSLFKIGDGATAWNSIDYSTLRSIDTATVLSMANQATPATPAAGNLNFFAKSLAGRMTLRQQGPSGLVTPLQPSFFQNSIVMLTTGGSGSIISIGNTVTNVGTISHPTATETYGYMTNFVTAGSANATAGTSSSNAVWARGSMSGANGFFFNSRIGLPDSSYNETGSASTGSRIFVGLTDQGLATSVAADNPVGNFCGFFRRSVNGAAIDTNWGFATKDGSSFNFADTGLVFSPQRVYDMFIFSPPQGTEIFWRIDNVIDGTFAEGSTTTNLPSVAVSMRAGLQVLTVNAVARNIRMQRVYVESDR